MPTLTIADIELYFELHGEEKMDAKQASDAVQADTVAFINGIAMTVQSWQPVREQFVNKGFRCLLHDCRGQLRSGKSLHRPFSFELHMADFLALLDRLNVNRVHLVGTSYGAEIGILFAATHPERVATLSLIACASKLDHLMRAAAESWSIAADCGAIALFRCMLPWAYSNTHLAQNRQQLLAQEQAMSRQPPEYRAAFKQLVDAFLQLDLSAELEHIECPTLVIAAEHDLIKGPAVGRQIHDGIAGSEFCILPDAGHALVLEQPHQVAARTIQFLHDHL
ncbi:MAG TPA: alpha/beta hydrolase [Chromatiaceae bacterium]|jgi:3-oxoadipate enol-lactonase|nr:MAG: hypothetical protein N838_05965 [Thiohalocapsa sp. PB-PSB1]QQO53020.1 MAG: alpha/beta fold hydrolase [Thiohalocapsa sp. PB-PSB1]HBG94190.1 alpha/beta hydrolase [Chromatiaceae bacterium]HCS90581.1 alpha/beta hydrolase [Chromatiaceae bacterium]